MIYMNVLIIIIMYSHLFTKILCSYIFTTVRMVDTLRLEKAGGYHGVAYGH